MKDMASDECYSDDDELLELGVDELCLNLLLKSTGPKSYVGL